MTFSTPFSKFSHGLISALVCLLVACGGGGGGLTPAVNQAPVANAGAAQNVVQLANVLLSGSASSDPEGSALTYAWVFTSTPAGNTAVLNNASAVNANFTPNVAGSYVLTLTVTDSLGSSATALVTITVASNTAPLASAGVAQTVYRGNLVTLSGAASSDANGHNLSYVWTLPTRPVGSVAALSNANTVAPTFTPDVTGVYIAQLIVTDSLGAPSAASTVTITVNNSPAVVNNALSPACAGTNCAATSPNQYSGSGTGVWRYNNTTASDATINLDINGISAGKTITMSFTNPTAADITTLPAIGTNVSTDLPLLSQKNGAQSALAASKGNMHSLNLTSRSAHLHHKHSSQPNAAMHDDAHHRLMQRNKAFSDAIRRLPKLSRLQTQARQQTVSANRISFVPPSIGDTRSWVDYYEKSAPSYATTNQHVCSLGNGRNAVFWKETADTSLASTTLNTLTTAACGSNGGFRKLINLVGDVWGSHAYGGLLIEDSTLAKQDINVVFIRSNTASWAGYFYGGNNFNSTAANPSNEALVFFVNLAFLSATNTDFFTSTLIHEARHMVNFYQNDIVRGKTTDTWLEETSAMMTEDIISPTVIPSGANKITSSSGRLGNYIDYGGALSLNKWEDGVLSYEMGGTFAAFLNRQYGVTLTQQLVTGCTTGTAMTNSYTCLNNLIQANAGVSLGEDLSRMGATVFSKMPATTSPTGFGYKAKVSGGYTLPAVDLSNPSYDLGPSQAMSAYKSTSQVYYQSTVPAGITRYKRNGVKVPAGTVLQVVIQ